MSSGIYGLQCKSTGKWYIGFSYNIEHRWELYKRLKCERQPKIHNALCKYGPDDFNFVYIEFLPIDNGILSERERFWIAQYNSYETGYNLNKGGIGGGPPIWSEVSKEKARIKKIGKPLSEEHCRALSIAQTGKKHSKATILKMSLAQKGKTYSPETIEKMRAAKLGKKHTEEHKRKIGLAGLGSKRSEETKQKMRIAGLRRYGKLDERMDRYV